MQRPPEGGLAEFSGEIGSEIDAAFITPHHEKPQGPRHIGEFVDEVMISIATKIAWHRGNDRETRLMALRYLRECGEAGS